MNPLLLSSSTLLTLTFNSSQRLISRVVLIPFGDNMDEVSMPPSTRDLADQELQQCMKDGYKAAGVMVSVGKVVCDSQEELHELMDKIACLLPGVLQRIYVSYSWLMLATLKVCVCVCVCMCVCAHTTFTS